MAAAGGGPSEFDQVLELNAKVRGVMADAEVHYFDYREELPPKELDEVINKRDLELPVVFVNGLPKFQGALPSVEELLAAIQKQA